MSITISDPKQKCPATYYLQVEHDLRSKGIDHAEMRPGADNVVWVNYGRVNKYYIFRKGLIAGTEVD